MNSPPRHLSTHGQPGVNVPNVPVDFSAWGINDATAQFGMQLGQSAVAAGQDYVQKNVCTCLPPPCVTALTAHLCSSEASSLSLS